MHNEQLRAPLLDSEMPQARMALQTPVRHGMSPDRFPFSPDRRTSIAAQRESKQRLLRGLWCTGVILRLLTVGNGLSLLISAGYVIYTQLPGLYAVLRSPETTDGLGPHVKAGIELITPLLGGFFLLGLEWASTFSEAAARSSLGFAFGACGRFLMFVGLALVSTPAVLLLPWCSVSFLALAVRAKSPYPSTCQPPKPPSSSHPHPHADFVDLSHRASVRRRRWRRCW